MPSSIITLTGKLGVYSFNSRGHVIEGGTGNVYKGSVVSSFSPDLTVGKQVAIKVLYRDLATNILNIIRDENAAKIQINHPNLLRMYEFVEWKKRYHLISEWLDGETLEERIKQYKKRNAVLPFSEINIVFNAILNALGCLHSLSPPVYHRDVKPGNIMLCHDGRTKLIDFGIVKTRRENTANLTQYGSTLGTPAYSPPEQIKGEHNMINDTSDLYALGNVIFETFTGHQPFSGTTYEISDKQINEPLKEEDCSVIPEPFKSFILKSTQKKQENRFQNVEEVIKFFKMPLPKKESAETEKVRAGKSQSLSLQSVKTAVFLLGVSIFFLVMMVEIYLIIKEIMNG